MGKQKVIFRDLDNIPYKEAWDYQEKLVEENVAVKTVARREENYSDALQARLSRATKNYLLVCEHPPVYTLGKSGHMQNVLLSQEQLRDRNIEFHKTNRGGDITFHGPEQIVGYPILDLEKFYTDIGRYMRELEEVIILTLAEYGLQGARSKGETGVWLDPTIRGKERKICAMGIRCSRWITMHGFAFNVNTDLSYFDNIIPCGIANKRVTSLEQELGGKLDLNEVQQKVVKNFASVFNVEIISAHTPAHQAVE